MSPEQRPTYFVEHPRGATLVVARTERCAREHICKVLSFDTIATLRAHALSDRETQEFVSDGIELQEAEDSYDRTT